MMRRLLAALILPLVLGACAPGASTVRLEEAPPVMPAGDDLDGGIPPGDNGETVSGERDLDGDGVLDCWRATRSRGGGWFATTVTVRQGCRGIVRTLSHVAPLLDLLVEVEIPAAWRRNPALLAGTLNLLYGATSVRRLEGPESVEATLADGSLRWLADRLRRPPVGRSLPFDSIRAWEPVWTPGLPSIPESQVAVLRGTEEQHAARLAGLRGSGIDEDNPTRLLVYRTRLHGEVHEAASCTRWTLHSTGQAVAARDPHAEQSAWIWVADRAPGPRHASVKRVTCAMGLVFIEPVRAPDDRVLVVVAPDLGRLGRIPLGAEETWSIDEGEQRLRRGEDRVVDLIDLRDKLLVP
ncbi:MAG: hypothetical protein ACQEXJ_03905 [Myxococcota bacterium]